MSETFCKLKPTNELEQTFVDLVNRRDHLQLDALLTQNPHLVQKIDTHWFSFDTPAIVAAKHDEPVVKVLLKHGANINERSSWWAGSFGVLDGVSRESAGFFIKRGARFDIHSAAEQGELELVAEFLERDPGLVNARGGDGQTPLHTASTLPIVDLLIQSGADLELRCFDHSATAVQYAVSEVDKCRHLIECGATPDIFLACALGDRALVELVFRQEPECLESVVGSCEHTSPVDPRSHSHIYAWKLLGAKTPLEVARAFSHNDLYQELFQRVGHRQQFLAACWDGESVTAKALAQKYPNLVSGLDEAELRLLPRAAWDGKLESVRLMLELGFDPHVRGDEASTALDRAAFHGEREIVELLIKMDPRPPLKMKNRYGGTPLGCCAYGATHSWKLTTADHLGTAKALIAAGAEIDPAWLPAENVEIDALFRRELGLT
ncbi:MAG: ankyrin repeat domain-containing protein [Planctomycetota bacterium]